MKTKLFIRLCCVILISFTSSCKGNKKVKPINRSKDSYVYIPILRIENKQLVSLFDNVIANEQKCSNYKEKILFTLQQNKEYRTSGNSQINTSNDHFVITNNSYFNNDSVSFKTSNLCYGCFWYKTHIFYVFNFFKNSGWFSKSNKYLRYIVKKKREENIYPPAFKESSQWFFSIRNGKIVLDEKYVLCY